MINFLLVLLVTNSTEKCKGSNKELENNFSVFSKRSLFPLTIRVM